MNRTSTISLAVIAVALSACATEELRSPESGMDGMLMVRPQLSDMEVISRSGVEQTIYAYPQEELQAGTVSPVSPSLNSGDIYYYKMPQECRNVLFSSINGSDVQSIQFTTKDDGTLALELKDQSWAGLSDDILFGMATDITVGNEEPYSVPLNRLSSIITSRLIFTDYDGNYVTDNSIQSAEVSYAGFATILTFDYDSHSWAASGSAPFSGGFNPGEEAWTTESFKIIPGQDVNSCTLTLHLADGSDKTYETPLDRVLSPNRSYTVTFRLKKANGSASFTIEEPLVYEQDFGSIEKGELFNMNSTYVLSKEAGSSVKIPVKLTMPYDWGYELVEGTDYFSIEQISDTLVVTALSENIDETRNGMVRLTSSAGHTKNLYLTQFNASKQVIYFTPSSSGNHNSYAYGENIEVDSGDGFVAVQSGDRIQSSGQAFTIQADCIYSFDGSGSSGTYSFSNCVSLTDLNIRIYGTTSSFDASVLPALRHLTLDNSTITGINFTEGQPVETLSLYYNTNIEDLNLYNICGTLRELNLNSCTKLKSLEIYPSDYSGDKKIESINFNNCRAMTGAGLASYTRLKDINLDNCIGMESINLTGCTSLDKLSVSNNTSSYINISNCSSLRYLSLSSMTINRIISSGCDALEIVEPRSVDIDVFDFSDKPNLKSIYFQYLDCGTFDVSGCHELTNIDNLIDASQHIRSGSIDISDCPNLKNIYAYLDNGDEQYLNMEGCTGMQDMSIEGLAKECDFSSFTELKSLEIRNSSITTVDLGMCPTFETLYINNMSNLSNLNIPASVKGVYLYDCPSLGQAIDLSGYSSLDSFTLTSSDAIPEVNLSGCSALTDCAINANDGLRSINLDNCTALPQLNSSSSNNSNISLESISLANCSSLLEFYMTGGKLTSLDFSTCPAVNTIDCRNNQMDSEGLNAMFNSLPDRNSNVITGKLYITGNPGAETCDDNIIYNKNWYFPAN